MWIDGVFSGGGIKAFAFVGALEVVEKAGFQFKRVAGTSAGAIVASLLAAGYTSREIQEKLNTLDPSVFMDQDNMLYKFPFFKWISLYWRMGLYEGDAFEDWMRYLLEQKGIHKFADLPFNNLKIIASDVTQGKLLVLPDDLAQYGIDSSHFSVARAVRMSASLPFFFEPIKLYGVNGKKSMIVDGGVLSNLPIWVFEEKNNKRSRPLIGFQLSSRLGIYPTKPIKNVIQLYQNLFLTMQQAHDAKYISNETATDVVFIPVEKYETSNFELSKKDQKKLVAIGRERTEKFLKKWSY